MVARRRREAMVMLKTNNAMLKMLPFIRILYLNQQSSILRCFSWSKFEKAFLAIRFSGLYFAVR